MSSLTGLRWFGLLESVVRGLLYMPYMPAVLNSARIKLMRGDYVAVCKYQFLLFIPDKNKHVVSDQTYNSPHNTKYLRLICGVLNQCRRQLVTCHPYSWLCIVSYII